MNIIVTEIVEKVNVVVNEDIVSLQINEVSEIITIKVEESSVPGISTYEIAVKNGFVGTELEWLDSQKNIDGGIIF